MIKRPVYPPLLTNPSHNQNYCSNELQDVINSCVFPNQE